MVLREILQGIRDYVYDATSSIAGDVIESLRQQVNLLLNRVNSLEGNVDSLNKEMPNKANVGDSYLKNDTYDKAAIDKIVEDINKSIIDQVTGGKFDPAGYATENWVINTALAEYSKTGEINSLIQTAINGLNINQYLTKSEASSTYATFADISRAITELIDEAPDNMNTLRELSVAIEENKGALDALRTIATSRVKQEEFEEYKQYITDQHYLTQHQDISHLATKTELNNKASEIQQWVENKNYLTEHLDISNLATKGELNSKADASSVYTKTETDSAIDAAFTWAEY